MVPPSNTPDDLLAYLWGCLDKKIPLRDPFESLGLYSEVLDQRREPTFLKNEANELYSRVREIARSYQISQRGKAAEDIQVHLAEEETFSREVYDLGEQYGPAIWGKTEIGHSRSYKAPAKAPDDLDWDRGSDRETIRFYIRCWIVRLVVAELEIPTRKKKGKSRREESFEEGEIADCSDSSDSSEIPYRAPYRAPEPPRNTGSDIRRNHGHTSGFAMNAPNRAANLRVNVEKEIETDTPPKWQGQKTPNKRKASDPPGGQSTGKLQKVSKENRPNPVPFRPQQRNPYSIPLSPTQPSDEIPFHDMFRKHRQRESAHDPDGTYQPPRCVTAETETVYDPDFAAEDESVADATDRFLRANPPDDEGMRHDDFAPPTAGPSGTYRNPHRQAALTQDSVIPNTQAAPAGPLLEPFQGQTTPRNPPRRDSIITEPRSKTLSPGTRQKTTSRRELFPLLLSYLVSSNQFDPAKPYNTAAELRMDALIRQLWRADTPTLRTRLGAPTFSRLNTALHSWLGMRDRLTAFQSATQYFGLPGDEWRAYLRSIEDRVARAQACIAYNELKGWEGEVPSYEQESFDTDLAWVFHLLTRVSGCCGAEEFAVAESNRQLLVWVRDEVVEDEDESEEMEEEQTEEETEEEEMQGLE